MNKTLVELLHEALDGEWPSHLALIMQEMDARVFGRTTGKPHFVEYDPEQGAWYGHHHLIHHRAQGGFTQDDVDLYDSGGWAFVYNKPTVTGRERLRIPLSSDFATTVVTREMFEAITSPSDAFTELDGL